MPLFKYKAINKEGKEVTGTIDAVSEGVALNSLQRRDFSVREIKPADKVPFYQRQIGFLSRVKGKDMVVLSRQLATLFEAQVSALRIFRMLADQVDNPKLQTALSSIADRLQSGSSISDAISEHDTIFSEFYINMVKAGEESGNLDKTFTYLAEYLDRNYTLTSKARNAMIYPAFVIVVFIAVMLFMFTFIIPRITGIIRDSGQDIPIYTKIVMAISDALLTYGIFIIFAAALLIGYLIYYGRTEDGKYVYSRIKLGVPQVGKLFQKLYLSRFSDNMHTMLASGVPIIQALQVTAHVVGNDVYQKVLEESLEDVKGGTTLSDALSRHDEMPNMMVQMVRVGEETGETVAILKTMAGFYQREVENAVESLVSLIEPVMIVVLGAGVGIILISVLMPIYNMASGIA